MYEPGLDVKTMKEVIIPRLLAAAPKGLHPLNWKSLQATCAHIVQNDPTITAIEYVYYNGLSQMAASVLFLMEE